MIIAKIDDDRFLELVRRNTLIAFQQLKYGYAVAAPGEAYYAPMSHSGGGNLLKEFDVFLGAAFIRRMSTPVLRTLRPTAQPIVTPALAKYLETAFSDAVDPMDMFAKAPGDHPAIIEYACQVVILAIEEHEHTEYKAALLPAKRDMMSEALDLVILHGEAARELCEVGEEDQPMLIRMHLLQSSQAMKTALEMLLRP